MKFVDPRNDLAFKKIFGSEENTAILISFLNAVLDLQGEQAIESVVLLNPYQAPELGGMKYTLLDIKATDHRGVTFIIEMQIEYVPEFTKRFLYYTAKAYVSQIDSGERYTNLKQVILIGILDFVAFEGEAYLTRHYFHNAQTGRQDIKDMELYFIELPKFTKGERELTNVLDQWIYFIKHARNLEMIPEGVTNEGPVWAAYEAASRYGWTREDLELYDKRGIKIQDERGALQAAEQRGEQRGRELGAQEALRHAARGMMAKGMEIAQVAEILDLSIEQMRELIGGTE